MNDPEGYLVALPRAMRRRLLATVPIFECAEPLCEVRPDLFPRIEPHPYVSAGAPYLEDSPYVVRQGVLNRLLRARQLLYQIEPGASLVIYDAYRPLRVQAYMVEHTIADLAREVGLNPDTLTAKEREQQQEIALSLFAIPDDDPTQPPPHSTGAAVDVTIWDARGTPLDMGSEIDAMPPFCLPNHFRSSTCPKDLQRHRNRELLRRVMSEAGFHRLPHEWWHFSHGDQHWALVERLLGKTETTAVYGRFDLL